MTPIFGRWCRRGFLLLFLSLVACVPPLRAGAGAPPAVGPVFKITFEYGSASSTGSLKGKVVGFYAPSAVWTGHIGVNYSRLDSFSGKKGIDETSPAALYAALGNIAAMRPDDLLQFYKVSYSGSFTTDNGCTVSDSGSETPDTYTAWIRRTKDGAVFQFGTLEIGDVNGQCDRDDAAFTKEFGPGECKKMEEFFTFRLSNQELAAFGQIEKTNACSLKAERDDQGTAWGRATLTAAIEPPETEVSVESEEGFDAWMPKGNVNNPSEPGNDPLKITITVHKKGDPKTLRKAYLRVSLPYVSKNQGICGNWPQRAGEEEGLRFRPKDFPEKEGLLFKDRTHLETDVPLEQAVFHVRSYDYGAWGTLRVTATDENGKDLKVKVRGKEKPDLDIPLDEDSNRIADAWERGKVYGRNGTDDDEEVTGQDQRGDGITLYNEYRGLVVLEGKN